MPRLPTPVSNPQLPQQVFTAESQGAAVARADQELAGSITRLGGVLQQRQTQSEISKLNAEFAKAQAELTVDWQETLRTADPNDTEVASRFRQEKVQKRLDALGGIAKTREAKDMFGRLSAGLGANFLVSTEAGAARLHEVAALQSFEAVKNQISDAVSADPFSFETSIASADIMIEGFVQSFGLSRENALKLSTEVRSEAAMAAGMGRITADPEEGRAFVEAGGFSEFIDAGQKAQLIRFADSMEASRRAAEERQRQELADARAVELVNAAVRPDGSIAAEDIDALKVQALRDARITGDTETAFKTFRFLDGLLSEGGAGKVNSPAVQSDLLRRAALPPGDPNRLTANEAMDFIGRGVDFTFVKNQLIPTIQRAASPDGQNDNERVKAHLSTIKSQLGLSDGLFASLSNSPRAQQAFDKYVDFFYAELARRQDAGETMSSILNQDSPTFIGGALGQFVPPPTAGAIDLPATPEVSISLDPQFRRVTFGQTPTSGKLRSPEELDKLLSGEQ